MQPTQSSGDINACVNLKPNDPNYNTLGCAGAAHRGGDENTPPQNCGDSKLGADFCCHVFNMPRSLEVSDVHPDCA